jgi:hypothetical protein
MYASGTPMSVGSSVTPVDSTVTSAGFGKVGSQGNDPRRMQFAAKVTL